MEGPDKEVGSAPEGCKKSREEEASNGAANGDLHMELKRLRNYLAHLESSFEKEKAGLAREIHDGIGQTLTGLKFHLFLLEREFPSGRLNEKIKAVSEILSQTVEEVRRLSKKLKPVIIDDFGLDAVIQWRCEEFTHETGIACDFKLDSPEAVLRGERAMDIFRIFQESLANVAGHAGATAVQVSLRKDRNNVCLNIKDNGRGIKKDALSSPESLGIIGMQERARFCGGEVEIVGIPGKGTTITISIPTEEGEEVSS